jgi:hypothetical protein
MIPPAAPVAALHQPATRATPAPLRDTVVVPPIDPALAAQRELQTPLRYRLAGPQVAPDQNWWAQLWRWLWDRWDALLKALERNVRIGSGSRVAIGDVLLVVVGSALVFLVVRLLSSFVWAPASAGATYSAVATRKSAQALLARATEAAERGEYGRAIRLLFVSAVALLDLRGELRDDESATVGELRRELRGRGSAVEPAFADLARAFTATAYAERLADGQAWRSARASYDQLARSTGSAS